MTNLSQLRERVKRNLDRNQITESENSDIDGWVNQIIREEICAEHQWSSMEALYEVNTTENQSLYGFPNLDRFKDCLWIHIRTDPAGDFCELTEISERELLTQFSETTTGAPQAWCRAADGFRLRPIPDSSNYTLRLRVWEYPLELLDDGASNAFTNKYSMMVELGVVARACLYYGEEPTLAQSFSQQFQNALTKAAAVDRRAQMPANLTLKPSSFAGMPASAVRGRRRF